jgi:hypothetical protein
MPPAVQKFIADVEQYVDPVQKAQRETKQFSREVERAGIAADKAMSKAGKAARDAAAAQKIAAEAAGKLEKGEIKVDEAARLAAAAVDKLTLANIAEREAALAAAAAADKEAAQLRQVARDAAMAAAVEGVAAAKATGSIKQHKGAIDEATKAFPELRKSSDEAFHAIEKEAQSAFGHFKDTATGVFKDVEASGLLMPIAIVAAIGAIPFAAVAASGVITGVLGGALGGLGVYATKGGATAKAAIKVMKNDILADAKSLVAPFNKVWVTIASDASGAFHDLYPELHTLFADLADVTNNWVDDITGSLYELKPAFAAIDTASQTLEQSLGGQMPTIMKNLSTSIQTIVNVVAKNPEVFTNLAVSLSQLLVWVAKAIDLFARFGDIFDLAFAEFGKGAQLVSTFGGVLGFFFGKQVDVTTSTKDSVKAFSSQADAIVKAQQQTAKAQTTFHGLATAEQISKIATDQLKQAFDRLTGANQTAVQAEINVQQAIDDTTAALKVNGKTLDLHTQKGRDNMNQLISDARAYQDKLVAMKNDGATTEQLAKESDYLRLVFFNQARQLGANAKDARTLTDRLLGIAAASKKIPRTIHIKILEEMGITASQAYLNKRKNLLGYAHGGRVKGYADGGDLSSQSGDVIGGGSETSDSILALLSKNEFVVNAKQAKKHHALLEAINSGMAGFSSSGQVMGSFTHTGMKLQKTVEAITKKNAQRAHFTAGNTAEYHKSREIAAMLKSLRSSPMAAWMLRGGAGSAGPNVVAQHTSVNLYVGGSVRSDRDLEAMIQEIILQRNLRNPTSGTNLPAGRVGNSGGS